MKKIIFSAFMICLICLSLSIAYGSDLTLRLVHPDHDKIAFLSPSEVKVDRKQYDLFEKDHEHYWVSKKVELGIADMKDAKMSVTTPPSKEEIARFSKQYPDTQFSLEPTYNVTVTLTDKGREKLKTVTEKNIRRRLAIIFNGKLVAAPIIMDKITGGEVVVSALASYEETKQLRDAINSSSSK